MTVSLGTFLQGLTDVEQAESGQAMKRCAQAEGIERWTAGGTVQEPLVAVIGLSASPEWTTHQSGRLPASHPPVTGLLWAETQKALAARLEQIGRPDLLTVLLLPAFLAETQQLTPGTSVIAVDGKEQAALAAQALFWAILSPGMIGIDPVDVAYLMAGRTFRLAGSWRVESWEAAFNSLAHCEILLGASYLVTITMPTYMTLSELDDLFRQIESKLPSSAIMLSVAPFTESNVISITCLVSAS
ncbi:hypothetical protein [Niveispirillum cyanobacteriorum]|nr:hypothetical protein [Niveispirillum cyanobacteriorum]GGE88909.1 hypothetical protein GCM10011317_52420 [Niveispirillum cyanobacteriorum]